jgi:hypothetical protein
VSDGKGDTRCGTETSREQYRREDLRYASDMTDAERALILPHPPGKKALGRPRVVPLRGVIDARDFPKRSTVQSNFYAGRPKGYGKGQFPAGPTGSGARWPQSQRRQKCQSAKTTESGGPRGYDAGRRATGASATSLPIPAVIWLAHRCTEPTSRIETALASIRYLFPWLRQVSGLRERRFLPMVPTRGQQAGDSACWARAVDVGQAIRPGPRFLSIAQAMGRRADLRLVWPQSPADEGL